MASSQCVIGDLPENGKHRHFLFQARCTGRRKLAGSIKYNSCCVQDSILHVVHSVSNVSDTNSWLLLYNIQTIFFWSNFISTSLQRCVKILFVGISNTAVVTFLKLRQSFGYCRSKSSTNTSFLILPIEILWSRYFTRFMSDPLSIFFLIVAT